MAGPDYKKTEQQKEFQNLLEEVLKFVQGIADRLRTDNAYSTTQAMRDLFERRLTLTVESRKPENKLRADEFAKPLQLLYAAQVEIGRAKDRRSAIAGVEKWIADYSGTAKDNIFFTTQQQNQMVYRQIEALIEDWRRKLLDKLLDRSKTDELNGILDGLKADLLNCTDPLSAFYSAVPNGLPNWAESPVPITALGNEQQQLLAQFGAGSLDIIQNFIDENGLPNIFERFRSEIRNGILHAVRVQRALDGLTIAIKQRSYGKTGVLADLNAYFAGMSLDDADLRALTDPRSSQAGFNKAVDALFEAFKRNPPFASLVLESNYGENAYCLNALLKEMGAGVPEGTIDKAAAFFKAASTGGYYSDLKRLEKYHPNIASSLVYDDLSLSGENVPVQLGVTRDKHDIVSMLSFLSAYRNAPFMSQMVESHTTTEFNKQKKNLESQLKQFNDQLKQLAEGSDEYNETQTALLDVQSKLSSLVATSKMDRFFGIVMGLGETPLPPCVSATVLQSKKTLSIFYEKMRYNVDSFFDILSQVVTDVSVIYQQPFGTEFEVGEKIKRSSFSRAETAYSFMGDLEKLPDPKLLDYMMQLLLQSDYFSNETDTNNRITERDLQQIVLDMSVPLDYMNSSRALYYQMHEDQYNFLQQIYKNAVKMVEQGVPAIYTLEDYSYGKNLGYVYLPDTWLSFIRGVFISKFKKFATFDPRYVSGEGDLQEKNFGDYLLQQSYTVDLMGRGNSNVRGSYYSQKRKDDLTVKANLQAANFAAAGMYITNGVINLIYDNIGNNTAVPLENIKGWQLNAKISAISPADMYLVLDGRKVDRKFYEGSDDEALIKELNMHAVLLVRTVDGWTRVALDQIKVNREGKETTMQDMVDNYAARYFVANRTQWSDVWMTEQAVENIPSQDRAGFLVGVENSQANERWAGLLFKTASNNWTGAVSHGWGFNKKNEDVQNSTPTIVTVGAITRENPEINWRSKEQLQLSQPTTLLASYQVIDKFYLLALGNKELGGGKLQWQIDEDRFFGANALFHFGHGVDRITGSARFLSSDWSANAFVDMDPKKPAKYNNGGFSVRYRLPNGNEITISGAHFYPPIEQQLNLRADELAKDFQKLSEEMREEMQSAEYQALDEDGKKKRNWEYTQRIISLMQQFDVFRSLDFMQDQRTELAVTFETPGWTGKVGLVQIGEQKGNYLVSMLDIGNKFSFTAGITSDRDNEVQNFAGMQLRMDKNYVFDMAAYNVFEGGVYSSVTTTLTHLYDYDNVWAATLGLIGDSGKIVGHKFDFFIGNQSYRISAGFSKLRSMTDVHAAVEKYLRDVSILHMRNWIYGASERVGRTGEGMTTNEAHLYVESQRNKIAYFKADVFRTDSWWNEIHDSETGVTITLGFPLGF